MKKTAKKSIRYALILLLLLVAGLIAAPFFIDANQYKSLVVDQAEKATGRNIEIGELHASLFPWVGVRIDGVKIANPAGFVEGDFLTVKSLDVQVALLPLFGGSYQIERFVLDTPKLHLERSADGFSNWEDLLPAASAKVPAVPAAGKTAKSEPSGDKTQPEKGGTGAILAALSAQSLRMNDGEVMYRDARSGRNIQLDSLNIELDDVQMERPVALRVSGRLNRSAFSLEGKIGPFGDVNELDVSRLPLKAHFSVPSATLAHLSELVPELALLGEGTLGVDVQLEQRPGGVRVMAGSLNLDTLHKLAVNLKAQMPDAGSIQIQQLTALLDDSKVADMNGVLRGLGGKLRYEIRVNTPEIGRHQLATWVPEIDKMYAAHPAPWKTVKLGMLIAGGLQQVDIRDLQLLLDGELVQISGNIDFAGEMAKGGDVRLRLASRALHIDPWLPQPESAEGADTTALGQGLPVSETMIRAAGLPFIPEAQAVTPETAGARIEPAPAAGQPAGVSPAEAQQEAVEPDMRFLRPWNIAAVMQVDKLFLRGLEMSRLRADVNARKGIIRINPLRFELAGGRVEESARLNIAVYPVRWSESVKVSDVQLQPVLKALSDNDMLSGKLQMDTHLSGVGLLPEAAMTRLGGKGNVLLRDGSIKGFDIAGTLRNIKTLSQGGGESKKTDFSQLSGSFNITNGVVKNDDLFMASPLFRLTGYGVVNLVGKQMDYHLKPRLVGTLVGQGDTQAVRKGLEVPLRLTGPLDAPQVKLEISLENLLGNKEAIKDIIRNRKSIFKNLLKGGLPGTAQPQGQQAQPGAQPARIEPRSAPAQSTPAQKPLDQLLNQILPGF